MTHYIKCHFNIFPNHNHDYTYCELYWGCHCGCTWRRACHMLHASQCPALNLSIYKKRNTHTHSISMPELLKRFWCHNSCKILCDLLYSSDVAAETAFLTHTHTFSHRVIWSPWKMPDERGSRMIGGGPLYFVNPQVQRIPYWEERVCVHVITKACAVLLAALTHHLI